MFCLNETKSKPFLLLNNICFVSEAYSPAILIANKTGVFYQNLTTGYTGTVITYSFGASYVDYKGEKEIYAILKSTKAEYYRIVRYVYFRNVFLAVRLILLNNTTQ